MPTPNEICYQYFNENTQGVDYVVGDIHGCLEPLNDALDAVGFDEERDRLFCLGDLVDRGEQSMEVLELLNEPWFFSVRGNHEQMAIDYAKGRLSQLDYAANGGHWNIEHDEATRQRIAQSLCRLPIAIELTVQDRSVGLVHAGVPYPSWVEFIDVLEGKSGTDERQHAIDMAQWMRIDLDDVAAHQPKGIDRVFVGHRAFRSEKPKQVGNVVYMDTGAVFGGVLSLVPIPDFLPKEA